ncbi:hypothetical protein [Jeotgalibacillus terrae]|uniref:ABC transporter permease n=1 Tax=Jeotgalibacillus terrae TaxID=587735 RepID=A0ABW5ZJB9_9BACL|nr:hypothetical protein [Jeotgalibacillus terrae]MBM7578544.1 membrane-associated HD superfamily phosphohydrolase [Jeotgalibacillus terrae]
MENDPWKIPYPSDKEIEEQTAHIVRSAFPKRRSFLSQVRDIKEQMGWMYLFPNRSELIFTAIVIALLIGSLSFVVANEYEGARILYSYIFFTSPLPIVLLTLYAMYEKREKHVMALEMTMKITIFQIIALRMLSFSGVALVVSMTSSFVLAANFDVPFLRVWLISLTGLFSFTALLLGLLTRGDVWRRTWGAAIGWVVINATLVLTHPENYRLAVFELPLIIYTGILAIAIVWCFYTFAQTMTRKQEGLGLC